MEITLNNVKVREMAARLREAFGSSEISQSKALETLSKTLGYPNWDTLSGTLKREEANKDNSGTNVLEPQPFKPFELFCDAFSCDEYGEGPGFATWTVDESFVHNLLEMQKLCEVKGLDHVSKSWPVNTWGNAEALRVQGEDLYVSKEDFWFRGLPKHCAYAVETRSITIEDLLRAIHDKSFRSPYLAWADGVLFKDGASAQDFARSLLDDGHVTVNEGCIDDMPAN